MRAREISSYYQSANNIIEISKAHPRVNLRYLITPSAPLTSGLQEMIFDWNVTGPMVDQGKIDANRTVAMGEGKSFEDYIHRSKGQRRQQAQ
jgi:hypothetical protein